MVVALIPTAARNTAPPMVAHRGSTVSQVECPMEAALTPLQAALALAALAKGAMVAAVAADTLVVRVDGSLVVAGPTMRVPTLLHWLGWAMTTAM